MTVDVRVTDQDRNRRNSLEQAIARQLSLLSEVDLEDLHCRVAEIIKEIGEIGRASKSELSAEVDTGAGKDTE